MAGGNDIKLLGGWFSPFTLRAQIALNIKGLEYENIEENLLNPKSDLLLQSNPVHKKIPVLIHGGKTICESAIIVQYIDEVWTNAPSILPQNAYDRAIARFWVAFINDKMFLPVRNILATKYPEANNSLFNQLDEALEKLEEAYNKLSEGKAFFGGDKIGFIDIGLGSFLSGIYVTEKMNGRKLLDEARTPGLVKWAASFAEHAAVKDLLPETDKLIEFAIALKQKWIVDAAAARSAKYSRRSSL